MGKRAREQRMPVLALVLLASVVVTEALLGLEGRWAEAIPLHLCSVAALAALAVACGARGMALDFLWYLGMPGALLALLFPAPASSHWQTLLNISYVTTHALILIVPMLAMLRGDRPRSGRAGHMLLALQVIALAAYAVNRMLGTDFLFLMAPPAGTPLVSVFAKGKALYRLALEAIMAALCFVMQGLLGIIGANSTAGMRKKAVFARSAIR